MKTRKTIGLSMMVLCAFFILSIVFLPVKSANAVPILGQDIYAANDGDVIATYLGATAAYSNDLYLYVSSGSDTWIFNNQSTPVGTTVNLGSFSAGDELLFYIYVNDTGNSFYSGSDTSLNTDGIYHAIVDFDYAPGETYVGFEDLLNGGDRDYDDVMFSFTNLASEGGLGGDPVPEPSTIALLGLGLVGLVGAGARKRRKNKEVEKS